MLVFQGEANGKLDLAIASAMSTLSSSAPSQQAIPFGHTTMYGNAVERGEVLEVAMIDMRHLRET
jgi:hypothetical protein